MAGFLLLMVLVRFAEMDCRRLIFAFAFGGVWDSTVLLLQKMQRSLLNAGILLSFLRQKKKKKLGKQKASQTQKSLGGVRRFTVKNTFDSLPK